MSTSVGRDLTLEWDDAPSRLPVGRGLILLWTNLIAATTELDLNEGFLLDIDGALKEKLQGIYVTDAASPTTRREVRVFYRWPKFEVTDQTFPFITVELLRFERAVDREQRGEHPALAYVPKGFTRPANGTNFLYTEQFPIPYNFFHQITVHSRFNLHDREISFALMQDDKLPTRGGYLLVGEGDNETVRQMFVTGPVNADGIDPQAGGRPKRHFRKVWTTQTSGEFFQKDIETLSKVTTLVPTVEAVGVDIAALN